jgi:ATP-binding cassette, subfamily B, bacterial
VIRRALGRGARPGWRARARVARTAMSVVWSTSPALNGGLLVVALVAGLISPAAAWLQRDLLDALVAPRAHPGLSGRDLMLVLALGAAGLAAAVVPQVQQYVEANLRRKVGVIVYDRAYAAASSWPGIARFESPVFADKLQLTSQLAQSSASSMITSALGIGQALITAVTFMVTLIVINPVLAALTAVIAILAVAASLSIARRQAQLRLDNTYRVRRQLTYGTLLSDAVAAKEVRLFGLGDFLRGRMLADLRAINGSERVLDRRELWVESGTAGLSAAVVAGGLAWVVAEVTEGHMPVGNVSLFVMAALSMQAAMYQIAMALGNVAQSVTLFAAYEDVVSAAPDLPVANPPLLAPPLRHGISVEDVWFRYDQSHPWVLRGVSMFIPAGEHVALVGLNGSGKSTMVKLLCRLYDPQRGSIRWDGVDIRDLDPAGLRQRITGVFQDYMSYDLTGAENIGLGDLNALDDREAIRRAAALAGIDEELSRLPDGYDTMLSRVFFSSSARDTASIGVSLSGGQRQRIALARALLRADRDLLIVDEPMSSLDAAAEHAVNSTLTQVQKGRTCVLISHRLAAVRAASQIIVIADGVVAEQGAHAELMTAGGVYSNLFTLQAAGYDLDAVDRTDMAVASPEPTR